ncbi:small glutamine-rich tetratricopeptide repeat-containing protein alpha-like isoform X2 [Corticium candelabrum]|uniref:small glutamine-rich tetratricopeptide repeat-containing protein alpha-like isoform X1 n=1 Tax=Corticium candelabrum TaxID=121492 RepID=UPI002E259758|nr:small glutamine-rich tetratricopeptide repeat-containing protein alpha-like isoform X1 [Corticium candelabrum]XP_062509373.1 small glutamine-rich tetratricopeptide repeat-containing protein alpha-like isoform X2 [Corticium candelabrum]
MGETRKRLALAIIDHLQSEVKDGTISSDMEESVEVAVDCLAQCYELNLSDRGGLEKMRVGRNLMDIFSRACVGDLEAAEKSMEPGVLSEEDKQRAEALKNEGNEFIKSNKFESALQCYNGAIEIDPKNPIYACNRAVAYLKMQQYEKAIVDCEKAIDLDPEYSKAYGRLGYAQLQMGKLEEANEAYEKALKFDPENESHKASLGAVKLRLTAQTRQAEATQQNSAGTQGNNESGASANLGGLPGLGGGLSSFFNNPAIMNMAQSVMSNPQLMQMASSFFTNPPGASASAGGGEGGQAPSMDALFSVGRQMAEQMQRENPEVLEQLRSQFGGEEDDTEHTPEDKP